MKRIVCLMLCCLSGVLLFGCRQPQSADPAPEPEPKQETEAPRVRVTVVNEVQEADVWILPENDAIKKTTLWGTATIAKLAVFDKQEADIQPPEEAGTYIFRMIDTEHFYYSANGVLLHEGDAIRICGTENPMEFLLEVTEAGGTLAATYSVFCGKL